jgi:hypothetical protein
LLLFDAAAWVPIVVGVCARLTVFQRDPNVLDHEIDPSPPPDSENFPIENDEPREGDPNFVPYDPQPKNDE